eukprot:s533_g5.t1
MVAAWPPKHPTEQVAGVTTKQLVEEVIPTLQINVAGSRSSGSARHWVEFSAMHRPMPLVARTMLQSSGDKAWGLLSSLSTPDVPTIPFMAEPPKAQARGMGMGGMGGGGIKMRKWNGMEPLNVQSTEVISAIQRHAPGWSAQAPDLWRYFTNIPVDYPGAKTAVRQTAVQKMMGGILGIKPTDPNVAMTQPKQSAEGAAFDNDGCGSCCEQGALSEVSELREELAKLSLEFSSFNRILLARDSGESDRSFSVVIEAPLAGLRAQPSAAAAGLFPEPSWSERISVQDPRASPSSWERRLEVSREIGKFLARAMRSENRGASGREKIPLASRVWLVAKGFNGEVYSPIRVFSRWGSAKDLVKREPECGDSVFVGLPSQREVECAIAASGFRWDGKIEG